MDASKKFYPTAAQKTRLVSLLEADEQLRQGKFSSTFTRAEATARWAQIAEELNSVPGCQKSWSAWRKTWQDMKSKTKKKQAEVNRQDNVTGGGPPPPQLSETEVVVLSTMSQAVIVGHTDSQESLVEFIEAPQLPAQIMENKTEPEKNTVTPTQVVDCIIVEDIDKEHNRNIEKECQRKRKLRRPTATKRLEQATRTASSFLDKMNEKLIVKKKFYDEFIKELRRHNDILQEIANNLNNK